ncbi:hypothetical protein SGLAM104S_07771 [Streptomyces glaucescens]
MHFLPALQARSAGVSNQGRVRWDCLESKLPSEQATLKALSLKHRSWVVKTMRPSGSCVNRDSARCP